MSPLARHCGLSRSSVDDVGPGLRSLTTSRSRRPGVVTFAVEVASTPPRTRLLQRGPNGIGLRVDPGHCGRFGPVPHSPVRFAARNTKPLGTVLLKRKQPWLRWGYLTPGVSWRGPDQCQDTSWTGSPRSAALRAKAPSKVHTAVPSRRARHTYVESVACRRRNRAVIAATS